jgi:hypothetical protein
VRMGKTNARARRGVGAMGGAGSFLGARMVDAKMSNVRVRYKVQRLKSEEVKVDGGETVIRCWVPWEQPERGVWSAGVADKPVVIFILTSRLRRQSEGDFHSNHNPEQTLEDNSKMHTRSSNHPKLLVPPPLL